MNSPIRVAVIGAGHLGRFHARLSHASERFQLIAVVDPVTEARTALASELDVAATAGHENVLDQIDAAIVATPTHHHHRVTIDLLRQGVHVLVEKPIAISLDEANAMVGCADENGMVLQVGHIERFNPCWSAAAKTFSAPKYIESHRMSGYTCRSTDVGVVYDLMIHDIDLVLTAVGSPVVQTDAIGVSVFGDHEDIATARLVFENGCVANLTASRVSYTPARDMQIWCPDAFVACNFADRTTKTIRPSDAVCNRDIDPNVLTAEQKEHLKEHLFDEYLPIEQSQAGATNPLADELEDFATAIRTGSLPQVTGRAGRDALAVCEQILASIAAHNWDGESTERHGPLAPYAKPTVRPPHWAFDSLPPHRKAG